MQAGAGREQFRASQVRQATGAVPEAARALAAGVLGLQEVGWGEGVGLLCSDVGRMPRRRGGRKREAEAGGKSLEKREVRRAWGRVRF